MIRILTLSAILLIGSLFICKSSSATTYVNYGTAVNYNLTSADSLFVASGTYTGNITGFASGARITISDLATFSPGSMPNNANGTIHNYGIFTYTSSWTVNTNFTVNNYAGGIMTFGSVTIRGNSQTWTNYTGGIISFSGDVTMNGQAGDMNNAMINYDSIYCAGTFQMNSGSSFTNYLDFTCAGDFVLNGGSFRNEGNTEVTGLIDMNSGTSVIYNYCKLITSGGIDNSNGSFYNYSYVWAKNSDIINTAAIYNIQIGIHIPVIHGRDYRHSNGGTMTGPARLYFYGTTRMTGGTIGVAGITTDTIKMYDVTRTNPSQIFDVQSGGTINPNVIYDAWGIPDSTRTWLFGCAMEVLFEIPLAINWKSFEVIFSDGVPLLLWSAEFDRETVFEIQRSYDGRNYSTIGQVLSADGKTDYRYSDKMVNTLSPVAYYRIKAVELGGEPKFSTVKTVRFKQSGDAMQIAPNPFKNNFNILYQAIEDGTITIRIYNMSGQQKLGKRMAVNKGRNDINITEISQLSSGVYIVQVVNDGNNVTSSKLIKQ